MSIYSGRTQWLTLAGMVTLFIALSCGGGGSYSAPTPTPAISGTPAPANSSSTQAAICNCTPTESDASDFRHDAKHVGLSASTGQEINVATMLSWGSPPDPAWNAPRTGRELQMFHIAHAFMWFVWLVGNDCDIHVEIADTADPNAPRAIVETPVDSEFCPARTSLQQQLSAHGVPIGSPGFNLSTPLPVEVLGLAFQDFNHPRGTTHVATVWEIHPAIVNVLPQ